MWKMRLQVQTWLTTVDPGALPLNDPCPVLPPPVAESQKTSALVETVEKALEFFGPGGLLDLGEPPEPESEPESQQQRRSELQLHSLITEHPEPQAKVEVRHVDVVHINHREAPPRRDENEVHSRCKSGTPDNDSGPLPLRMPEIIEISPPVSLT